MAVSVTNLINLVSMDPYFPRLNAFCLTDISMQVTINGEVSSLAKVTYVVLPKELCLPHSCFSAT